MTPAASEFVGTFVLVAVGTAAWCSARLARTAGSGMSHAALAAAWGAALCAAMFAAPRGDAHLNPAVTLAAWMVDRCPGAEAAGRVGGQFAGTLAGMAVAMLAFVPQLARDPGSAAAALWRTPEVRAPLSALAASAVAAGLLVFVMLRLVCGASVGDGAEASAAAIQPPFALARRAEAATVAGAALFAILAGFGGSGAPVIATLGPCGRLIHAALPLPGKARTDWRDAWISLAGPALGALLAAWAWRASVG
jgi:glycerol uptake facilitator protein